MVSQERVLFLFHDGQ